MLGLTDEARTISELQRLHASSGPCTPASSRAKVVSGLENFGRNLLFGATPGSMRGSATSTGESGADVFGSPARRSRSAATKSSSSDAYSSATSNAHTYSTAPTSVHSSSIGPTSRASAQAQQQRLNVPEPSSPRKLVKKRRGSEVGALGGGTLEDSPGWDAVRSPGGDEGTPRRTGLGRGMESWNAKHKENGESFFSLPCAPVPLLRLCSLFSQFPALPLASPNSASLPRPRAKSMFSPLPQSPGPERAFESSDVNHDPTETYGSKSGESANSGRRPLGPRGPVQASPGPVHRHPDRTHLSVSEDERAVPGGSERARQTRRVPSSSKRGLPLDATPVGKPAKRHARVSFDGSPSGARERSRSRSPCPPQPSPHSPAYPRTPTDARPRSRSRSRSHCPPSASPSPRRANSDGKLIPREQLSARINAQLERAQEDAEHSRSAVEKLREEVNVLRKNLRAEIVVKGVHGANPSPRVIEAQGRIPKSRFVNGNSPAVDSRDLLAQGREAARGGKVDVEFLEIWMERVEEWIEEEEERLLQTIKTRELLARDVQDMESLVSKVSAMSPSFLYLPDIDIDLSVRFWIERKCTTWSRR